MKFKLCLTKSNKTSNIVIIALSSTVMVIASKLMPLGHNDASTNAMVDERADMFSDSMIDVV